MTRNARFALSATLLVLCSVWGVEALAQTTVTDPYMAKQFSNSVRGNMFMRLGVTSIFNKNKSGDAYDVTGPVITQQDLAAAAVTGNQILDDTAGKYSQEVIDYFTLESGLNYTSAVATISPGVPAAGLGTPAGIKARVGNGSTPTLSVGYWLSDDYTWVAEAYVLAAPITIRAYGEGKNYAGKPNGLSGKEILSTKMLPPLVMLGRYFRDQNATFRPYLGVGATYAVFFDGKTTSAYNDYVGGRSTVSLKNAFGIGPFAGLKTQLSDNWHVNLSVGQIKLKTEATLVTYNTKFVTGSQVIKDFNADLTTAVAFAETPTPRFVRGRGTVLVAPVDPQATTKLMQVVALSKNQTDLGTYERKQKQEITSTIVTLSVGRSF